jgi:hypothetical protein
MCYYAPYVCIDLQDMLDSIEDDRAMYADMGDFSNTTSYQTNVEVEVIDSEAVEEVFMKTIFVTNAIHVIDREEFCSTDEIPEEVDVAFAEASHELPLEDVVADEVRLDPISDGDTVVVWGLPSSAFNTCLGDIVCTPHDRAYPVCFGIWENGDNIVQLIHAINIVKVYISMPDDL